MRRAILRVTPDIVLTFLMGLHEGGAPRAFRVVAHALPSDTRLVCTCHDPATSNELLFVLESDHFTIAPDARVHPSGYPYLESPLCEVEYFK